MHTHPEEGSWAHVVANDALVPRVKDLALSRLWESCTVVSRHQLLFLDTNIINSMRKTEHLKDASVV